jgi:predicted nucleotidyltransferase
MTIIVVRGREYSAWRCCVQLDRPLLVVTPTVDGDVLAALARAEAAFTGRGLHRLIGRHSADGVRRAVERLARQGVVDVAVAGPSKLYSLNREHLAAVHVIALAKLREDFLDRLRRRIAEWRLQPVYAALFGSAATEHMRADSDVDLFVVRPDGTIAEHGDWAEQLRALAHDGSRWTGNDLRIFELSEGDVKLGVVANDQVLLDIRDQGIRLAGPTGYLRPQPGSRGGSGRDG